MALEDTEPPSVPSLREETRNQQRAAVFKLIPAMIVVLAAFAGLGIGKYWSAIPPVEGAIWTLLYGGFLLAALFPLRQWKRNGGFGMSDGRVRTVAYAWAFGLGCLLGVGCWFGMMTDDLGGRVTFGIMITGLGGVVLSVTYMIPGVALAFFTPFFLTIFIGGLQIDPHVTVLQKTVMFLIFVSLFVLLIRFNWRLFQSGVRAAVERETHRMEVIERRAEMDAARRIQMGLLPSAGQALREEGRYDLAALLAPAREMTGDLYDFFPVGEDRLFFMVGDVCGKGVASSLLMAITKTAIKNAVLRRDIQIGEVMTEVNRELARENHDHQFVTCLAGMIDLGTGAVRYSNAGHEPMIVLKADGSTGTSDTVGGPPLCAFEGMDYETGELQLSPGDGLLLFSDGVTEAGADASDALGVPGLRKLVESLPPDARPSAVIEAIGRALDDVPEEGRDDTTLMAIRFHGG